MARGISLEELGGDRKDKIIQLKKPKKPNKKRQKQNKKPANNRNIVYDDLFDQYRNNNNANYNRNYQYNGRRTNLWEKGFKIFGFFIGLSLIALAVVVAIGIIFEVAQFISNYCGEICCFLGGLYFLAETEY
jgi:hypothetical protein